MQDDVSQTRAVITPPEQLRMDDMERIKQDFLKKSFERDEEIRRDYGLKDLDELRRLRKEIDKIRNETLRLKFLPSTDPTRQQQVRNFMGGLYDRGLTPQFSMDLYDADYIGFEAFTRRRLAQMLVRLKIAKRVSQANALILKGRVEVSGSIEKDPTFLVSREVEHEIRLVPSKK